MLLSSTCANVRWIGEAGSTLRSQYRSVNPLRLKLARCLCRSERAREQCPVIVPRTLRVPCAALHAQQPAQAQAQAHAIAGHGPRSNRARDCPRFVGWVSFFTSTATPLGGLIKRDPPYGPLVQQPQQLPAILGMQVSQFRPEIFRQIDQNTARASRLGAFQVEAVIADHHQFAR